MVGAKLGFLLLQLTARCRITVDGERRSSIYICIYISVVNAYQKCPPHPQRRLRAERNSAQFFFCFFPRLPPENTQSLQNSNKFTTSQSSQNISKTQRFSHAAKNEKKFSKLDCSLFFETAKNNPFPNQKHGFHEFQKGPTHKQNAYISQSSHNDKNMLQ